MSLSTKYKASDNSGREITIERNRLWENVRIYYKGELIKTCKYASETREGVLFNVENLGTVSLKVHSVTLAPTLTVNGIPYLSNKNKNQSRGKLLVPTIVFGILGALNLVFFLLALERYNEFPDWPFASFVLLVSIFYMLSYTATTIFLARRIYFFYFYGAGIFTLSTLYILLMLALNGVNPWFLSILIIRILTLALLLRYLQRTIRLLRAHKSTEEASIVLDDEL